MILLDLKLLFNTVGVIQRNVGKTPIVFNKNKKNWKSIILIIKYDRFLFLLYRKQLAQTAVDNILAQK